MEVYILDEAIHIHLRSSLFGLLFIPSGTRNTRTVTKKILKKIYLNEGKLSIIFMHRNTRTVNKKTVFLGTLKEGYQNEPCPS